MKRWFTIYVLTLRKDLMLLLLAAVLFIFAMDMWLKFIPAPNSFFVAMGSFWYALSISYVSSFVFYFIIVHYNRQKEKVILYQHIGQLFHLIIEDGKSIFTDMSNKQGNNITFDDLTEQTISDVCSCTNPFDPSPVMGWKGNVPLNWLSYLVEYKQRRIKDFLNTILLQMPYLDVEFVDILNQLVKGELFEGLDLMFRLSKEGRLGNQDFGNGVESGFIEYYRLLKKSEEYYNKEFTRYL